MITYRVAKRQQQSYFYTNWIAGLTNGLPNSTPPLTALVFKKGLITYQPKAFFRNIEKKESRPLSEHFAIFTTEDINTTQRSLPGGRQHGVGVKFTTPGIGVVQLFFSKDNYSTVEEDFLTAISHEMFLGKTNGSIWFRNPTVRDLPAEENHFRTNVTFEYTYDTHVNC